MLTLAWLRGLAGTRGGRLAAAAGGVAIAVALLASLGSFLASAKATMTQRATQRVAVDWQVEAQPGADPAAVARAVRADPHVATALPVGFAASTGFHSAHPGAALTTGPGQVLGLPPNYAATFPGELRYLTGARSGALLAQQTAANLHAAPGDRISIGRAGLPPVTVRVDGIVDLPQADSLFQKVGAPTGAQPQAPPDNILLLPESRWHTVVDPLAARRPDLVRAQLHARLRSALPADPAAAYTQVTGAGGHLDVTLAGAGLVGNNLAAALGAARQDALYAQVLFLFLGLPGAVLAALLTAMITGTGAVRRRREQALLRARGATGRGLLRLAAAEALLVGAAGAVTGLALAAVVGRLAFGSAAFGTVALGWVAATALTGFAMALLTVLIPVRRDLREATVVAARQDIGSRRPPRWMRFGVDGWLLVASLAVFWATSRSGYHLVLAPEGVSAISVSYWAFAGPALLWAGAGLLAWRLVCLLLGRGRPVTGRLLRPVTGRLSGTVAATLARQRALTTRTVVLVGLSVAFAASTATFSATYGQQAEVDAQLTNGAAVTVTEPATANVPPAAAATIRAVPGVAGVEPLQHRFAYVGSDLQDLYGIRPETIGHTVRLQDAYFHGGTARQLLARLARQPDAVLVSAETVTDFQLQPGDLLRLRLLDARTQRSITVPFHYAGVAKEFPTAPTDSFLVANARYVADRTGSDAVGAFLVTTRGTPPRDVAARVRATLGPTAQVTDIQTTRRIVGSSLTAVDLSGLTKLELGFALALAGAATGLLLTLGFTERRRSFALARALGARRRQLGAFVWGEIAVVGVAGLIVGALAGSALAQMLVKVLTGVFDPPPDHLAVPWAYLAAIAVVGCAGLLAAGSWAVAAARRPALDVLRDL